MATFRHGTPEIAVLHGPMVEVAEDWCAEAVWAGGLASGDFDRTDLVFGSGVRCREDHAAFVSSGSTLDRLWYCAHEGMQFVSNSLPAMLAVTGLQLREDYRYADDLKSICLGLGQYIREFPTTSSPIRVVYFSNLHYDGQSLAERPKPDLLPPLQTFQDYHGFLLAAARSLAANANDPARAHPIAMLTTISSGYDSPATAVLARSVGCRDAVTIRDSTSLWRGSDSGERLAERLGLRCRTYDRTALAFPEEESIWAVVGRPGVLNWTLFDYPEPLCLFFTGCHGDKVWARDRSELPDPFVIASVADLGIGEFRLLKGVYHCPVPFWGMRHVAEIRRISLREEMGPWTLGVEGYDRPVPRRVVEEAGIPRRLFGMRKKNTSHESIYLWPYSPTAQESCAEYCRQRGYDPPSPQRAKWARAACAVDALLGRNLTGKIGFDLGLRHRWKTPASDLLFQWANDQLRKRYTTGA